MNAKILVKTALVSFFIGAFWQLGGIISVLGTNKVLSMFIAAH